MSVEPQPLSAESSQAASLEEILRSQEAVFEELAELAREHRRALSRMETKTLERVADRAETLATRFRLLDDERERIESAVSAPEGEAVARARASAGRALRTLLKEGAVSSVVLNRLADTVAARRAAVASLFGATYLANGRQAGWRVQGSSLSAEG